ncbi:MAG: outer membrane beta-barrel protein [Prevotella sp.]
MKRKTNGFMPTVLLIVMAILPAEANGQNEERRWAIDGNLGFTFIKDKTGVSDNMGQEAGRSTYLGAEYFIPHTHFSVRAGYQSETLRLGSQLITADQQTINIGGRWYPAPERWAIQPHAGIGANILLSDDNSTEGAEWGMGHKVTYQADINSPRVALTPSVGLDIYLFSSLALYVDYTYNLGFNNAYDITYSVNDRTPTRVHGNLNHHNVQIGLKLTFPFRFTSDDMGSLLKSILMSLMLD